jgi:ribonuclease E
LGGLIVIDFIDMGPTKNQRDVEDRLRDALKMDRARVQVGKLSRFGLLEMSRQRLRPSLGESTQVICPQCNGEGRIRGIESLSLSVLRLIEEDAMKERTSRVVAQVPVTVATFLLNEKRSILAGIEQRCGVNVVLVPNPHLDMPKYDIQRLRDDEVRQPGTTNTSYKLVTAPEPPPLPSSERNREAPEQPAVKGLSPSTPAPIATAPEQPSGPGIFVRIWRALFGTGEKKTTPERHREHRGPRQEFRRDRDRDRGGRHRDRGDRPRSRDRDDRDRNPQRQGQSQGGGNPRRDDRNQNRNQDRNQDRGERHERQERRPAPPSQPQQQANPAPAPVPAPVQQVAAVEPVMQEQATPQPQTGGQPGGSERQSEGGQRRGRRRGRRGGRRRRFEERGQPGENRTAPVDPNSSAPTLPQLRHDNGGILAKPASPEERQHFEAQERGNFHEPEAGAEREDRTMPNPYRIPETVERHDAVESTPAPGNEAAPPEKQE